MRPTVVAFVLALAGLACVPGPAGANVIYEYRSTCTSIVVSPADTVLCADLPSDEISVTVIVRDSYVPGTFLTPEDVISVVYRDPFPFSAEFVTFGVGDIEGVLPASSGEPGSLLVRQGESDILLAIERFGVDGWAFVCCGMNNLHLASGPPGVWIRTVAEPSTLALAAFGLYGLRQRRRKPERQLSR